MIEISKSMNIVVVFDTPKKPGGISMTILNRRPRVDRSMVVLQVIKVVFAL